MTTNGPDRPGLQPHRTSLAWNRTALAMAALAALTLRAAVVGGSVLYLVATAVLSFGALVTHVGGRRHGLRDAGSSERPLARLILTVGASIFLALVFTTAAVVAHDLLS